MDLRVSDINRVAIPEAVSAKPVERSDDFNFTLRRLGNENLAERLEGLIGDITTLGDKLAKHMDIKDMRDYRGKIKEFIEEVVTNSHEFSRENFLDRRGRHRVYGIVKLVNKDLDELAQELLKKEKDHIAILEKTDEIRGLLLDMII